MKDHDKTKAQLIEELKAQRKQLAQIQELEIKHRQLQEALCLSEERFRTICENAPVMIDAFDLNGRCIFANREMEKRLGWTREQIMACDDPLTLFYPDPKVRANVIETIKSADGVFREYSVLAKDGSTRIQQWADFRLPNGTFISVGYDITDQKEIERALQAASDAKLHDSEARFSAVLDNAEEAIVSIDDSQRIILFNKGAEKTFGYSADEIKGKPLDLLIPRLFQESHRRLVGEFSGSEKESTHMTARREIFGRRKNGAEFPADASVSKLEMGDKSIMTVILSDITERKRSEQSLRDALAEVERLKNRLLAENLYLQEEIKLHSNFEEIISQDTQFKKVLYKIEQVAATRSTVLILGETGTGKELIARAIHNLSPRKTKPLVKVNCSALSSTLIQSELFGHEKGAFTGAIAQNIGRFELADGGTLFLDEIGDLPLDLQSKLLRVLQEGEFERVGGGQPIKADVRLIAATHCDLASAVERGDFRSDLYYRLNVFPISLPPLREREGDIPLLVQHFVKKYSLLIGKKIDEIPQEAMDALLAYPWPGNIRELENVIERAVIITNSPVLRLGETMSLLRQGSIPDTNLVSLAAAERKHILLALEVSGWKIEGQQGAAARLDINPNTLRSRMKKLGIKKP
jgi:PAS domain S-box-containing protein